MQFQFIEFSVIRATVCFRCSPITARIWKVFAKTDSVEGATMDKKLNSAQSSSQPQSNFVGEFDFEQWSKLVKRQMIASLRKRQPELE